ncbi:hypothetical protein BDW02DRAFT_623974 [Decorospora gaudefroyi]|uniref:Arb2 domain-containing protein n=1 Tax=Decorospora gaudefroyi TaxID=184978 RepID=A0A6A5KT02_9PLEO|nr:hypothetical protein BDW02DRAFT_623974 [Decorospora gaudefroyi]
MFRRIEESLEPDPAFPADLRQLGFFVNNVGAIRMIDAPDKPYVFHATNNERVNEVRREAMQTCQRNETEKRLAYVGLNCIHLPKFAMTKPNGPHVPILAPAPEMLKMRKRVIVLVNDSSQDLGILAYRQLQRELGINGGSLVNFVKNIIKRSATENSAEQDEEIFHDQFKLHDENATPALVVLNTGQLLYSHKYDQAMTLRSWSAMPRKSITHDMVLIHEEENRVDGHRNPSEHVRTVFDQIICNPERVAADAEVYVIAIEDGTEHILDLLADDLRLTHHRSGAIHSLIDDSQIKNPQLRAFLHQRARQWKYTDVTSNPLHCTHLPDDYEEDLKNHPPLDSSSIMKSAKHIAWHENVRKAEEGVMSAVTNALHRFAVSVSATKKKDLVPEAPDAPTEWASGQAVVCPTFAGGDNSVAECVFTDSTVQNAILSFFEEVAQDPETYRNPAMEIHNKAPQPTPDNPLVLSADHVDIDFAALPAEMSPEQAELDSARQKLAEMRIEFDACPVGVQELEKGRDKLAKNIIKMQTKVEELEKKALGHGGLKAGEAVEKRENWKPQTEGPKVPFAGTMVDSELLKAAGLVESAKGGEGDEEKAFI